MNCSEVSWLESIVLRRQSDTHGRGDDDVGSTCKKLGWKMVKIVLETSLHDRFIGLLGQNKRILIITVPLSFIFLLVLVDCLELVRIIERPDIRLFLHSFIDTSILVLVRLSNEFVTLGR